MTGRRAQKVGSNHSKKLKTGFARAAQKYLATQFTLSRADAINKRD